MTFLNAIVILLLTPAAWALLLLTPAAWALTPTPQILSRRQALASVISGIVVAPACESEETVGESVRNAASALPGLGPPDVLYPMSFRGRWTLTRDVANVTYPQGLEAARDLDEAVSVSTLVRFVPSDDHVVADRGFNAEQLAKALGDDGKATWDASNPNVLVVEGPKGLREVKVTKRSFEEAATTLTSSEYARVAIAGRGDVPQILAQRTQTKWKVLNETTIQGLELLSTYDPKATGFSDLNGATPVRVVKTRLVLVRRK